MEFIIRIDNASFISNTKSPIKIDVKFLILGEKSYKYLIDL